MIQTILIVAAVLMLLALERGVTLWAVKNPGGRSFIRKHAFIQPNGISVMRFPQGVVAVILAMMGFWGTAILWFSFWMITDLTDGTIARGCDLKTPAGQWLDPLADKFMSFPVLLFLALGTADPHPRLDMVIAYCVIDIIGQCSRFFCKKKAANSFGKVKTALITILIGILALYHFCAIEKVATFPPLTQLNQEATDYIMGACVIMAFLSLYCKVIPSHFYANSLTLLNFLCGIIAACIAWNADSTRGTLLAFLLIFLGQFFDLFDGKMAKKFGSTPRGALYDDIADGTSFGIACGIILYKSLASATSHSLAVAAPLLAVIYVYSVFFRLKRFLHPKTRMPEGIFQGLPSPAGALLAGAGALILRIYPCATTQWACAALALLACVLMVSHIPYRHFGRDLWPSLPTGLRVFFLLAIILVSCFALVQKGWSHALLQLTILLTITYALGAIAPKGYVKQRLEEAAREAEEAENADDSDK